MQALSRALLATVAYLSCAPLFALTSQSMHFDRLSVDDGLSQSNVQAIAQDQAGFLWFATENGLNRYDGYNFHQYRRDREAADSLASDFVADLAKDARGNLWLATGGGGVARWNADSNTFTTLRHNPSRADSIADDHVNAIETQGAAVVWIGTRHNGLDRLDIPSGKITHFRSDPDNPATLSHNEVYDLAIAANGIVWAATHGGLSRIDPKSGAIERLRHDRNDPNSLSGNVVKTVYVDSDGAVWAGMQSRGLNRLDPTTGEIRRYRHDDDDRGSLSNDRVQSIFEDADGRFWVGTASGLNLLDRETGKFRVYRHDSTDPASLSSDNIVSLFQDRSGVLWVGTKTNGLSKWNPRSWSFGHVGISPGDPERLSNGHISSFTEDRTGQLWVGTFGGGLNVLDDSLVTVMQLRSDANNPGSISDDVIMALLTDRDGQIWVGTMGGGLNRIDPESGTVNVFRHDPENPASLAENGVMSLFEDSRGTLWVGTFGGGLSRLDDASGVFTNFAPEPGNEASLSSKRATAIAEDKNGVIWVGTDGGGLNYLDAQQERWHRYGHDQTDPLSLSADTIYALHVDASGRLWIGTRSGLDLLIRDSASDAPSGFKSVTQLDGLANDAIYGIQSDAAGNVWLSTNYGLSRYNPASGQIRNFHRSHGLQGEEFNFGAHFASSSGQLFFGGSNGFNAFDPSKIALNTRPPNVVLTAFDKLNKPVATATPYELLSSIELGHADAVISLEFAALDFVAPAQNRYAYMLDGFDREWVDAGTERRITYTNLDPGDYVLRVKAANSDGVWSAQPAELPLHIAPPPWKTWWAYLLYTLAVAAVVHAFIRSQQRKLEREAEYSKRLETEVDERTQELAERNRDLREANDQLHQASHTDALTGLRNRRYLFDEIARDIDLRDKQVAAGTSRRRSGKDDLVFVMVDLDYFKPVNDSLGHLAGDQMLLQVRDALLEACRTSDVVIRWGGDEFLVVARETDREDACMLVERIRSRIAERVFALGGGQVARTTTSIGFACYPFLEDNHTLLTWEQVLGVADAAMYSAKELRNAWCGYYADGWSGSADGLVTAIKLDAEELVEAGTLQRVESDSFADKAIA